MTPFFPIICALSSLMLAQGIKGFLSLYKTKQITIKSFIGAGGMPSSHSAMVIALTVAIGLRSGIQSTDFFICCIFSSIVLYDAAGIRRAAGKQAAVLNTIIAEWVDLSHLKPDQLKELLGHTPLEVFVGSVLGLVVSLIGYWIVF